MTNCINTNQIFGLTEQHLAPFEQGDFNVQLNRHCIESFSQLKQAALNNNIKITIASSFRSFARQSVIWNDKFTGKRPVYDRDNQLVDMSLLNEWQKVQAILTYSALPGASRHHWGTDIDVYDANAISSGYQLQLIPEEYANNGVFSKLSNWIKHHANEFGFYQPYLKNDMGIAQELWHLSYAPQAKLFADEFKTNATQLLPLLKQHNIQGYEAIIKNFEEILNTYVYCASAPSITNNQVSN